MQNHVNSVYMCVCLSVCLFDGVCVCVFVCVYLVMWVPSLPWHHVDEGFIGVTLRVPAVSDTQC